MDVPKEHADSPIMPTVAGETFWEGLASSGWYRAGLAPRGSVRDNAFSFKRMSA
jgi:hypothetical protein